MNASVVQLDRTSAFNEKEPSGWKIEKLVSKGDYFYAKVREHPNATTRGYVLHHRIVVENHLGRLLNSDEVVHHKDGGKKNNSIVNLEVLDKKEHAKHHALEQGRKYVALLCPVCYVTFERPHNGTHLSKPKHTSGVTCCSKRCGRMLFVLTQLDRKTPEVERAISENILFTYIRYVKDNAEETYTKGSVETIRTSPETVKT